MMVAYDVVGGIAMVAAQGAGGCATSLHVGSVHGQADEGGCGRRPCGDSLSVARALTPPESRKPVSAQAKRYGEEV